jgi:hypothetical protein
VKSATIAERDGSLQPFDVHVVSRVAQKERNGSCRSCVECFPRSCPMSNPTMERKWQIRGHDENNLMVNLLQYST